MTLKKYRVAQILSVFCLLLVLLVPFNDSRCKAEPGTYQIQKFWDKNINYLYEQQVANNACGPASIQIALVIFNVTPLPTQVALASEMKTSVYEYTYTSQIPEPFNRRGIGIVFNGNMSSSFPESLEQLKGNISLNRPAILLMWYDSSNTTGHYRVVTGYNETGFFFHDPYDISNKFFDNSLFEKLWTKYDHWELILESGQPYRAKSDQDISLPVLAILAIGSVMAVAGSCVIIIRRRRH